ncbi:hypothetical protein B6I21_06710 [candidate division KSB1 bacterium 4572_119]|nr:MAG: hypothetical protein B6I21_06710 [candidate division KSB1 bacterium 4572_119]
MTNSELIKTLSSRLGQSQVEIKRLLKSSVKIMKEIIDEDVGVSIPGLGTFKTFIKSKRRSYNPYHKKFMVLPPKRVIKFRSSSSIKNELKFTRQKNE